MTEQEAREFVEMLAVPEAAEPPPCPICGCGHPLESRCVQLGALIEGAGADIARRLAALEAEEQDVRATSGPGDTASSAPEAP